MTDSVSQIRPRIKGLLIDISGNLHVGSKPTPNAVEAFQKLHQLGLPFRLCSNTSKESTKDVTARLNKMGFGLPDDSSRLKEVGFVENASGFPGERRLVWTSIVAVTQLLKDLNVSNPFFVLTDSARQEVMRAMEDQLPSGIANSLLPQSARHDAVIIGLAPKQFDYETLNVAFRILKGEHSSQASNAGTHGASHPVPLIATHKAKYIQTESGLSMGPGPFVTALENAAGVQAHVVGKPTRAFFEMVIGDMKEELSTADDDRPASEGKIAIIGDDVEADLGGGAVELDLWRVLVRTGKYRPGDERRHGVTPPDEVFDSFAEFVASLT